jgi:hypothetical protein
MHNSHFTAFSYKNKSFVFILFCFTLLFSVCCHTGNLREETLSSTYQFIDNQASEGNPNSSQIGNIENWWNSNYEFRKNLTVTPPSNELTPIYEWNFTLNEILSDLNIVGKIDEYTFRLIETDENGQFIRELPFNLFPQIKKIIFDPTQDSNSDGRADDYNNPSFDKKDSAGNPKTGQEGIDYDFWIDPKSIRSEQSQGIWLKWTEEVGDQYPDKYEGWEIFKVGDTNINMMINPDDYLDFWYKIEGGDVEFYFYYTYELNNTYTYAGAHRFDFYCGTNQLGKWIHLRDNFYEKIRTNTMCYSGDYDYPNPIRPHGEGSIIKLLNFRFQIYDIPASRASGQTDILIDEVAIIKDNYTLQWEYPEICYQNQPYYFSLYCAQKQDFNSLNASLSTSFSGSNYVRDALIDVATTEWSGGNHSYTHLSTSNLKIWSAPSIYKLFKDQSPPIAQFPYVQVSAAKNEPESFQLIINANNDLENLQISFSNLSLFESGASNGATTISNESFTIKLVEWVEISIIPDTQGDYGFWPDPLPAYHSFDLIQGMGQPLWITVRPPENVQTGNYSGSIYITWNGGAEEIPFHLQVFGFILDSDTHLRSAWGIHSGNLNTYHGLTTEAQKREIVELYSQYMKYLRIEYQNSYYAYTEYTDSPPFAKDYWVEVIPVTFGNPTNTSATIDFTTFALWAEKYLDNMSFKSFNIPFPRVNFLPQFNGYDRFTSGYNASFISYLSEICSALESHNWLSKAYYYIFDEPLIYEYEDIIRTVELCRQAAPDLKILLTEPPCSALNHSIDIWVPYTLEYDEAIAQNQIAQGDESWWYTYAHPKSPYANLFINEPGFDHRILFWTIFLQNVTGFLYWGVDVWQYQDVWKEPMTVLYGNGDGYIFYNPDKSGIPSGPIISGPVSSVRAELIREGIEDYDCFYLLRNLTATVSALGNPEYTGILQNSQILFNTLSNFATDYSSYSKSIPEMIDLRQSISYQLEILWIILYKDTPAPNPWIPGYNIFVLLGVLSVAIIIMERKWRNLRS